MGNYNQHENYLYECYKIITGEKLQSSNDLATNACTTPAQKTPKHISDVMKLIHDEVVMKYYGCGLVVPECLEGMNILGK